MNVARKGKGHAKGGGRFYLGLAISAIALCWLAKKLGWLGMGSSGVFWPLVAIGLGLGMAVTGSRHRRRTGVAGAAGR